MDLSAMPSSSRILYDVPCAVCHDHSSGKHYGVYACDGCAGFFKRSVRRQRSYACKARAPGRCLVDKTHRNQCRACRMDKCLDAGMNRDAVQHERGPRNSTIRRQMALLMNDRTSSNEIRIPVQPVSGIVMPKIPLIPHPPPFFYPFLYTNLDIPNPLSFGLIETTRTLLSPTLTSGLLITNDPAEMCEAAATLLFMNVKWAKGIPAFENLAIADRMYLLGETWKDLFVIGAVQFLYPLDLNILLDRENSNAILDHVELFQNAMTNIARLRPYSMEFTCLRGITLFRTGPSERTEGGSRQLQDPFHVAVEHERNKNILNEYVRLTHPLERYRVSQLLELLPIIRQVPTETIEDLFFRTSIGNISIETIISDMYKSAQIHQPQTTDVDTVSVINSHTTGLNR